jgi:hypothetical protein
MRFKELSIGQRFKFVWSGYEGTKTGGKSYTWHAHDGKDYPLKVGSTNVEVKPVRCPVCEDGDCETKSNECGK